MNQGGTAGGVADIGIVVAGEIEKFPRGLPGQRFQAGDGTGKFLRSARAGEITGAKHNVRLQGIDALASALASGIIDQGPTQQAMVESAEKPLVKKGAPVSRTGKKVRIGKVNQPHENVSVVHRPAAIITALR
jgi:hypothetical protein